MFPIAKQGTVQFAAPSGTLRFERGKILLPKGVKMQALALKCTLNINNTSGGALQLTDAQRQLLLQNILITLNVGKRGQLEQIFVAHGADRVQREYRRASNREIPGYGDSTTGLFKSLPNAATTAVVFTLPIPTGLAWWLRGKFKDMWGMGPSQARLTELEIRIAGTGITGLANVILSGQQTFDILPWVVPQKGDMFSPVPKYEEKNEVDKVLRGPVGLHLALVERSNVQSAAVSTSLSEKIDAMEIYNQLSAADLLTPYSNSSPLLTTQGDTTDRETIIYSATTGERPFNQLPVGEIKVTQDVKDLATFQAGFSYVPLFTDSDVVEHVDHCAKQLRGKDLKAVSYAEVQGLQVPDSMRPYLPMVLFDREDKEWDLYGGLSAGPSQAPKVDVPLSLQARAKKAIAAHEDNGEQLAKKDVAKRVAVHVPGAVQSGRGFARQGSALLTQTQKLLSAPTK